MIFRSYMFLVSLLFFCGTLQPRTIFISHDTGPAARGGEGAEAGVGTDSSGKRRRTAEAAEFVGTTLVVWNDRITDHSVFEITTDHVRTCAIGDALKLILPTDEHPALKDLYHAGKIVALGQFCEYMASSTFVRDIHESADPTRFSRHEQLVKAVKFATRFILDRKGWLVSPADELLFENRIFGKLVEYAPEESWYAAVESSGDRSVQRILNLENEVRDVRRFLEAPTAAQSFYKAVDIHRSLDGTLLRSNAYQQIPAPYVFEALVKHLKQFFATQEKETDRLKNALLVPFVRGAQEPIGGRLQGLPQGPFQRPDLLRIVSERFLVGNVAAQGSLQLASAVSCPQGLLPAMQKLILGKEGATIRGDLPPLDEEWSSLSVSRFVKLNRFFLNALAPEQRAKLADVSKKGLREVIEALQGGLVLDQDQLETTFCIVAGLNQIFLPTRQRIATLLEAAQVSQVNQHIIIDFIKAASLLPHRAQYLVDLLMIRLQRVGADKLFFLMLSAFLPAYNHQTDGDEGRCAHLYNTLIEPLFAGPDLGVDIAEEGVDAQTRRNIFLTTLCRGSYHLLESLHVSCGRLIEKADAGDPRPLAGLLLNPNMGCATYAVPHFRELVGRVRDTPVDNVLRKAVVKWIKHLASGVDSYSTHQAVAVLDAQLSGDDLSVEEIRSGLAFFRSLLDIQDVSGCAPTISYLGALHRLFQRCTERLAECDKESPLFAAYVDTIDMFLNCGPLMDIFNRMGISVLSKGVLRQWVFLSRWEDSMAPEEKEEALSFLGRIKKAVCPPENYISANTKRFLDGDLVFEGLLGSDDAASDAFFSCGDDGSDNRRSRLLCELIRRYRQEERASWIPAGSDFLIMQAYHHGMFSTFTDYVVGEKGDYDGIFKRISSLEVVDDEQIHKVFRHFIDNSHMFFDQESVAVIHGWLKKDYDRFAPFIDSYFTSILGVLCRPPGSDFMIGQAMDLIFDYFDSSAAKRPEKAREFCVRVLGDAAVARRIVLDVFASEKLVHLLFLFLKTHIPDGDPQLREGLDTFLSVIDGDSFFGAMEGHEDDRVRTFAGSLMQLSLSLDGGERRHSSHHGVGEMVVLALKNFFKEGDNPHKHSCSEGNFSEVLGEFFSAEELVLDLEDAE